MDSRFPLKLTMIAAMITVLTTLFVTAIFSINHSHTIESEERSSLLKALTGEILLYDEQLTASTRLAAHSGDLYWADRYGRVVEKLDKTITQTLELANDPHILAAAHSTDAANQVLVEIEDRAFEAVRQRQQSKAIDYLNSQRYQNNKQAYTEGMEKVVALVDQEWKQTQHTLQQRFKSVIIVVMVSLFLTFALWVNVYRAIQRWRALFAREQRKRAEAEDELRRFNEELEARILERTAQLEESQQELLRQANFDELTGLPNRRHIMTHLHNSLAGAEKGERTDVMLIDLDHFKQVNDSLGHTSGDAILQQAAQRFQQARNDHIVIARLGGDEFLVVLNQSSDTQSNQFVDQILCAFNAPFYIDQQEYKLPLSPSIGIAISPDNGTSAEELVRLADIAMYASKHHGRNTARFFEPTMAESNNEKLDIESKLRVAVRDYQQFELFYQPQVDLNHNQMTGVEALLRWHQPDIGMIPPDQFIPVAEDTGLIIDIGKWVLTEAVRQQREWMTAYDVPLTVSINVASQQLAKSGFADTVQSTLDRYAVDPMYLGIEITERSLIGNDSETRQNLHTLHRLGVKLSLDDFGTGYSSLSYLKDYPFDYLKIDKSFIDTINDSRTNSALVEGIIRMSEHVGLIVVGEGIETLEQSQLLKSFGCGIAQGYHYGRPLPSQDLIQLLLQQNAPDVYQRAA